METVRLFCHRWGDFRNKVSTGCGHKEVRRMTKKQVDEMFGPAGKSINCPYCNKPMSVSIDSVTLALNKSFGFIK